MNEPVIVECTYPVNAISLWNVITHPVSMREWFFETMTSFRPEEGFETKFDVNNNGKIYTHIWKVLEVDRFTSIKIDWRFEGYSGESTVLFELFAEANGTRLRVTNTGLETFPQDNPDFTRESCTAGWNYFLRERLKKYIADHNLL